MFIFISINYYDIKPTVRNIWLSFFFTVHNIRDSKFEFVSTPYTIFQAMGFCLQKQSELARLNTYEEVDEARSIMQVMKVKFLLLPLQKTVVFQTVTGDTTKDLCNTVSDLMKIPPKLKWLVGKARITFLPWYKITNFQFSTCFNLCIAMKSTGTLIDSKCDNFTASFLCRSKSAVSWLSFVCFRFQRHYHTTNKVSLPDVKRNDYFKSILT